MATSRRKWQVFGGLVGFAAVLVTSVAVAVSFRGRGPNPVLLVGDPSQPPGAVSESTYVRLPALMLLPEVTIQGRFPQSTPSYPWMSNYAAAPFPRESNVVGRLASARVQNPGVRIGRAYAEKRVEKPVRHVARPQAVVAAEAIPVAAPVVSMDSEINGRRREISECASRGQAPGSRSEPPSGKIALRWVVRADGSSGDVQVKENTVIDGKVSRCVLDTVRRWKFSAPPAGDAPTESTFVFL